MAVERTKPDGRVVGVDVIPAQPPRGVSTIQGNFLSRRVRNMLVEFLVNTKAHHHRRPQQERLPQEKLRQNEPAGDDEAVVFEKPSYVDLERTLLQGQGGPKTQPADGEDGGQSDDAGKELRLVDVRRRCFPIATFGALSTRYLVR